ncbi:MAG: hypothetical protein DI598_14775 [Pseudopedobacter saltans]|uniref:Uncharacterized protein n=1 Tax=Pseudopedobacter saltans TaxID=151895 RepID=A0A2W5EJE3_9SPHI|nr:MAG: hypothetical protein DI598_14775 [Pseudopedobacter saltans]
MFVSRYKVITTFNISYGYKVQFYGTFLMYVNFFSGIYFSKQLSQLKSRKILCFCGFVHLIYGLKQTNILD